MKLSDLVARQAAGTTAAPGATGAPGQAQGTSAARPAAHGLPGQAPAPGTDAQLRRAAAEVLRIFDTGVGNAGITGSDWLMAMAELRAALGQPPTA